MDYKFLDLNISNKILTVTLNRPSVFNALNSELLDELSHLVENVKYDKSVSVIIFTGMGGKAFCAGADLNELQNLDFSQAKQVFEKGQSIFRRLELIGKPTIAAINGHALGGGFELALACSLRIASENATFALPEVKLGMIPGYGGTQRLPRLIGKGKSLELMLLGKRIDAKKALSYDIVNEVTPQENLLHAAVEWANEILKNSQVAVSQVLQAVEMGLDLPMDRSLTLETLLDSIAASSEEQREGVAAFLEKRQPNFN
jgi:enoyl-CoA hydratase